MITRSQLRGKPLDLDCREAVPATNEYGINDDRVFCYGLYKEQSVTEIRNKCRRCKAFVENATPMKGGTE